MSRSRPAARGGPTIVEECVITFDANGRLVFGDPETGEPTDELVPDGYLDGPDVVRG